MIEVGQVQMETEIQDERSRKRQEIGLSAGRPTAKAAPQRPPDETVPLGQRWWLIALFSLAALATTLLILARFLGSPTNWSQLEWPTFSGTAQEAVTTDVTTDESVLNVSQDRPSQAESDPSIVDVETSFGEDTYKIEVEPGQAEWMSMGVLAPVPHRVATEVTVSDATPDGYGGLMGRYQDDNNFYLFWVNGQQEFQVLLQSGGQLYALRDWTALETVNPAGSANQLAIEDNGRTLKFFNNDTLLMEIKNLIFPVADVGVIGGATGDVTAEVAFERFELDRIK